MATEGTELWLVRHGETEWSRNGKHTSVTDLPLTDEGERVARGLPDKLAGVEFDLVLTSPRLRARRTSELAGFGEAEVDEDLVEWAYGDYEGITTPEIRETDPGWSVWTHPTPNGESADDVATRLDRVVERARGVDRALVFSHGHALRALAARWLDQPVELGRYLYLDTATTSVLGLDRGSPVVIRWNA
jgi:broad specificity phosphatase PhoE